MDDLFKKFLYTGVGIVSTTAETLQKSVNEWVDKGSLSKEEGRKIIDDFVNDASQKKEDVEEKVKDLVQKAKDRIDLPTREEIENLNARIADLEAKLADQAKNKK